MAKSDSEELGMSAGKARAILLNAFVLHMAQKLGTDNCFRCRKPILSSADLSYDHKESWRGVDIALFWNVDNLALSHKKCNRVDRPRNGNYVPGMAWCTGCQQSHPIEDFDSGSRSNGLSHRCRESWEREEVIRKRMFACPQCSTPMRKTCRSCGYDMTMKDYMALRRREGVSY